MTQKQKKPSYIKEAEQNALNMCKYYTDMIALIDDMEYGMVNRTEDYRFDGSPRQKLQEGFNLIRQALYQDQQNNLARCFLLVGVGGKEAEAHSKKEAMRAFNGKFSVTELLDEYFRLPHCWKTEDEDGLKKEIADALEGDLG